MKDDKISGGLAAPGDHKDPDGDISFGYRIVIQLQDDVEAIAIPNCCITGHSVSLNSDGVTEETLEFASHVQPIIAANAQHSDLVAFTTDI